MPALALISRDPKLHQELLASLEGSDWSVEWIESDIIGNADLQHAAIVLDAKHPGASAWGPDTGPPVLLVLDEGARADAFTAAAEIVYRPTRRGELLARLDRLHAGYALADAGRRNAKAFTSMPAGVVVLGPGLEIVSANPRSYEIVGHRRETIGASEIARLISPEDLPRIRETLAQGHYPRGMDVRLVRRDGRTIVCACSFAPMIGAEDHTVISFEEVTHQRETEHELMKTMGFLESLIDASVDAIIATDMEQRVMLFNPSAERISGRHVADVVGVVTLDDLLGRATAELVTKRVLSSEHGGEGRLEPTVLDFIDFHGQRIPVQLSASLIYEDGEPSAIVLICGDLRDQIRVEERLAEAQKKLAFTEKQGVLAEIAGTAAHELNQPLTSMMAYAELLLRQSEPDSSGAKAARVLIRESERMAEIVRKIGKITRYETTSYVGHQKIFDLDRAADASGEPGAKG